MPLDLEEQEQLDQLKAFWQKYRNLITGVLTVVLFAYAAYSGYGWWRNNQALEASKLYETMVSAIAKGDKEQTLRAADDLQKQFGNLQLTFHFHNTRGMGLANVLAAVQSGITRFDGSLGGLGGCPYAPGASGNISSEDAIHMLDAMGYDTGINIPKLLSLARELPLIVGHPVPGQVAKAGGICDLHPTPAYVEDLR